ncbi:MAG TPA: hypothetical protein PLA73_09280 [Sedimentibacter sp.]|nr:hypothetical protein [Sedimentibacter sp.]
MRIKFLNKTGMLDESKSKKKSSPHYDNLDFLEKDTNLRDNINKALDPYFDAFFNIRPYMHSGQVSVEVCKQLNIADDSFHHGLVGSLIYELFKNLDPVAYGLPKDTELVASKGDEQHYVEYFLPQ